MIYCLGTALRKVHELACKEMEEVQSKSAQITKEYQQSLTDGDDYFITFFNTLSFGRKDEAVIESQTLKCREWQISM